MRLRATHLAGAVIASAGLGIGAVAISSDAGAHENKAQATLYSTTGIEIGKVDFSTDDGHTKVSVHLDGAPGVDAFHGFHIHANNNPSNGDGCIASGNFVSADGHWKLAGETHGHHQGDMPSVYVNGDGSADSRFTLDRFDPADLPGKVVILHAGADNFGNVPVGAASDQYTANGQAALDATAATGNAGARVACGVIGQD